MVFGPLANTDLLAANLGIAAKPCNGLIFVITVTATIILVAALSSLLYHYGVLQLVVRGCGVGDATTDAYGEAAKGSRGGGQLSSWAKPKRRS